MRLKKITKHIEIIFSIGKEKEEGKRELFQRKASNKTGKSNTHYTRP